MSPIDWIFRGERDPVCIYVLHSPSTSLLLLAGGHESDLELINTKELTSSASPKVLQTSVPTSKEVWRKLDESSVKGISSCRSAVGVAGSVAVDGVDFVR